MLTTAIPVIDADRVTLYVGNTVAVWEKRSRHPRGEEDRWFLARHPFPVEQQYDPDVVDAWLDRDSVVTIAQAIALPRMKIK